MNARGRAGAGRFGVGLLVSEGGPHARSHRGVEPRHGLVCVYILCIGCLLADWLAGRRGWRVLLMTILPAAVFVVTVFGLRV